MHIYRASHLALSLQAGNGGGLLVLNIGSRLHVDGVIASRGLQGSPLGGGGSGGTILINAYNVTGHGTLDASGGSAWAFAGGGSGGKLFISVVICLLCYACY